MFESIKKSEEGQSTASLIDEDMRITGAVVSSGDIILAGILEGEINCRQLVVAENGKLTGTVNSVNTEISGEVAGDVVSDNLHITSTGHFEGSLKVGGIEVVAGANVTAKFKKPRRSASRAKTSQSETSE